jgi:hypothetical protein
MTDLWCFTDDSIDFHHFLRVLLLRVGHRKPTAKLALEWKELGEIKPIPVVDLKAYKRQMRDLEKKEAQERKDHERKVTTRQSPSLSLLSIDQLCCSMRRPSVAQPRATLCRLQRRPRRRALTARASPTSNRTCWIRHSSSTAKTSSRTPVRVSPARLVAHLWRFFALAERKRIIALKWSVIATFLEQQAEEKRRKEAGVLSEFALHSQLTLAARRAVLRVPSWS